MQVRPEEAARATAMPQAQARRSHSLEMTHHHCYVISTVSLQGWGYKELTFVGFLFLCFGYKELL